MTDPAAPVGLDLDALRQHAYDNADGDIIVALLDLVSRQQGAIRDILAAEDAALAAKPRTHDEAVKVAEPMVAAMNRARSLLPREPQKVCSVCGGPWGLERPNCDYSKGGRCEGGYIVTPALPREPKT